MVNVTPKKQRAAFTMRVEPEFLEDLDDLRASQRPVLTRSDMMRELVHKAHAQIKRRRRK